MENERLIERGLYLVQKGHLEEALKVFEEEFCFAQHPGATSYYALCLAEVEGDYDRAVSLCLLAAEREFYNPDVYFNLGRIFLLKGQKVYAIKSFKKGLQFGTNHAELVNAIKKLGSRRKPIVPFLPRHHFINKFLGRFIHRRGN